MAERGKGESLSVDWDGVKREWLANKLSIREIARVFLCSETAIRKKAKLLSWPDRDDVAAAVRRGVRNQRVLRGALRPKEVADAVRTTVRDDVAAVDGHIRSVTRVLTEADHLVEEVGKMRVTFSEAPASLEEVTAACGGDAKRALVLLSALSSHKRMAILDRAASIYSKMIPQHRLALNLDEEGGKEPGFVPLEARLRKYAEDAAVEASANVVRLSTARG